MSTVVVPDDLATYLGVTLDDTETARAQMLIDDAIAQALSIVTVGTVPDSGPTENNLPAGSASVIRPAVARIYLNPAGVTSDGAGPFNYGRPAGSGSMYSKAERATLRRLAGQSSGAFMIDLTPDDVLSNYTDPLARPTAQESFEYAEETGFTS